MPYIGAPYKSRHQSSLAQKLRSSLIHVPLPDIDGRQIDLCPWPSHFDSHGIVHFTDNGREEFRRLQRENITPDIVIFATGYTQTFPFLHSREKGAGGWYRLPLVWALGANFNAKFRLGGPGRGRVQKMCW
ncbi:hypothetical protein QBC35DRAFT_541677 [Podospora australis]|uniref:Monooxygenase n=1 Tax=Podospora australis TaxID=1536484 RepID=A0AAN7AFH6_9PEZI|nr:hypothetical protein QBC35DRAFT_541677 [Podospora australis]